MLGIDLHSLFKKKIGNGSTTRFWLDRWVGNAPLCFTFPRLFRLDSEPQCYVSDRSPTASSVVTANSHVRLATGPHNMPQNINSQQPAFSFDNLLPARPHGLLFHWAWTRLLRSDAEKDELLELESLVSNLHLSNEDDKWECLLDGSRMFSVKGMRKLIINSSFPTNESRTKWNKLVPIKVNIASWRMENQRIPTRVNLDYRGIDLHSVRCPVCDDDLETEEHILVKCVVAKNTWAEILKWWNIHHIRIDNLNEVFTTASRVNLPSNLTVVFDAVIQSTLWILWRFRNDSIFAAKRPSKSLILNDVKQFSFDWISNRFKKAKFNWIEWLYNPCNSLSIPT